MIRKPLNDVLLQKFEETIHCSVYRRVNLSNGTGMLVPGDKERTMATVLLRQGKDLHHQVGKLSIYHTMAKYRSLLDRPRAKLVGHPTNKLFRTGYVVQLTRTGRT